MNKGCQRQTEDFISTFTLTKPLLTGGPLARRKLARLLEAFEKPLSSPMTEPMSKGKIVENDVEFQNRTFRL